MRGLGRTYAPSRGAYTPRLWPLALVSSVPATLVPLLTHPPAALALVAGVLVGFGVVHVRYAIWKRRHPSVSFDEYTRRQREMAPWN
jgi:uncharacterized membrane-anchored protein